MDNTPKLNNIHLMKPFGECSALVLISINISNQSLSVTQKSEMGAILPFHTSYEANLAGERDTGGFNVFGVRLS